MDPVQLKKFLSARLTNRALYPRAPFTASALMVCAAHLACAVVDELYDPQEAQPLPRRGPGRPPGVKSRSARMDIADGKRKRIKAALVNGPLIAADVARRAKTTQGETANLLRHTPGIAQLPDKRWELITDGAGDPPGHTGASQQAQVQDR